MRTTIVDSELDTFDDKQAAFADMAQKNRRQLLWVAARITSSREEAEDIVQESLLRALRALPRFRGESQMTTWLHAIVRNMALEYLRRRKGRILLSLEPFHVGDVEMPAPELPDPGESPEDYCVRIDLENLLRAAIVDLTPLERVAIKRCIVEELPYRSGASELSISVGALKSTIFRGKRRLKATIGRRTHGERPPFADLPQCAY